MGMRARSQLAIMDFNQGSCLQRAETKKGDKRFNVSFSKVTKQWSAKPIKAEKNRDYLHQMVAETLESAKKKEKFSDLQIPELPKNIAKVPKPEKRTVIENQKSRFGTQK